VLLSGCTGGGTGEPAAQRASAPQYLGAADGSGDAADSSCSVVLRSIARVPYQAGFMTTCETGKAPKQGPCKYIWRGVVDVAADKVAQLAGVSVLLRAGNDWYSFDATPSGPAAGGFVPHAFEIDEHTPGAGTSLTSLMGTVLNVIPYVVTKQGGRLFDHNRIGDPLGNYRLDKTNSWAVVEDADVCAPAKTPEYRLTYGDYEHLVDGPVRAGGKLKVSYDSRRLRLRQSCLGAKGPASATTIHMGYMFDGDGKTAKELLLESYLERYANCDKAKGSCVSVTKHNDTIDVPESAKSLELWFYCVPGFSSAAPSNWKYDSNYGANYQLLVPRPRAIGWAGEWRKHASRSGFVQQLPEPYVYRSYSNMGFSVQAEVYAEGLTDEPQIDQRLLQAFVETDLVSCKPGGPLKRQALYLARSQVGPYRKNVLYRWSVEASLAYCPRGIYRYRFLFSADGGLTFTPLGKAASSSSPGAASFRTIRSEKP